MTVTDDYGHVVYQAGVSGQKEAVNLVETLLRLGYSNFTALVEKSGAIVFYYDENGQWHYDPVALWADQLKDAQ